MVLIERKTLGSPANTLAFTSPLPTTFKHLRIVGTGLKAGTDSATLSRGVGVQCNSGGLTFDFQATFLTAGATTITATATLAASAPQLAGIGGTRGTFTIDIIDYQAAQANPGMVGQSWAYTTGLASPSTMDYAAAQATAKTAITAITLILGGSINFASLDVCLYGIS